MNGCSYCKIQSSEWAEDHTHLQNLCRKAGFSEAQVEGDSYGVPGIMDLADMLYSKINATDRLESGAADGCDDLQDSIDRLSYSVEYKLFGGVGARP